MSEQTNPLTPEEARAALSTVNTMEHAGWRRAVPPRWIGAGYAIVTGGACATFALERLHYNYFFWWGLAYLVLAGFAVKSAGADEREFHPPKSRRLSYWSSTLGILIVGFGSIYLRYEFDAGWIAIVGGVVNGLWLYLYYEVERQQGHSISKTGTNA